MQTVVVPTTAADEVDRFPPHEPFATPYAAVQEIPSPVGGMDVEGALAAATAGVAVRAAFAMPMVVMRSLPRKATSLRSERASVI